MLGMTIGVAAVIAMVALGSGAQETVSDDLQSAGTTLITVRAGNYTRGGKNRTSEPAWDRQTLLQWMTPIP